MYTDGYMDDEKGASAVVFLRKKSYFSALSASYIITAEANAILLV